MTIRYNERISIEEDAPHALGPVIDMANGIVEGGNKSLTWRGYFCWKNPLDLMIYQEIVHEVKPRLIVETGTHAGGSALFWHDIAHLARPFDAYVLSVDTHPHGRLPEVAGINFVTGSSVEPRIVEWARNYVDGVGGPVLVNLDSDHSYDHVYEELDLYAPFVTPGSYVIVEDGVDDFRDGRSGPYAATVDWLKKHPEFEADLSRERLGLTNCPGGFLRRLPGAV